MTDIKRYEITTEGNKVAARMGAGTEFWYPPIKIIDRQAEADEIVFTLSVNGGNQRQIAVAATDTASIACLEAAPRLRTSNTNDYPAPSPRPSATRTPQRHVPPSVARATGVANVVEVVSWIFVALSVIGGLAIAASTEIDGNGDTTHPNVGIGIALAVGGAFQCLLVIMVATYVRARLELARS